MASEQFSPDRETQARTAWVTAGNLGAYGENQREYDSQQRIENALPLVRHIVSRIAPMLPGHISEDDLIAAGTLGLVKAARNFDPSRGAKFETYAYIRIRGSVIDELRSSSFVPAQVQQQIQRIRDAYGELAAEQGQPPTFSEVASHLDMPEAQLHDYLSRARCKVFLSLDDLKGGDDEQTEGGLADATAQDPARAAEQEELREALARFIMELPQRERHVVFLYYQEDLTMKEIGQVLGVTESRVSQLHAQAIFRLTRMMEAHHGGRR